MSLESYENYYVGESDDDGGFEEVSIDATISIQDKVNLITTILANNNKIYRSMGRLAIVKNKKLYIAVDLKALSIILATTFKFSKTKVTDKGRVVVTYHSLDDDHLRLLQERIQEMNLREITFYSNIPVLERESEIKYNMCLTGYNPLSCVYVGENNLQPVYKNTYIEKALSGFPFKGSVDKINVIGFLFTGFLHHLFPGRIPSIRIEGNQRNVGKTLLAMGIAVSVQGSEGHILSLSDNEDEIEKRLCSIVINGEHVVIFDNVKPSKHLKEIGGTLIERLITALVLQFRVLGSNNIFSAPNNLLTIITTNGAESSADFISRSVAIELFVSGNPVGKKFAHKDLIAFITDNLDNIRSELLGMLDVWVKVGCPLSTNVEHRFQSWGELVGGILEVNGFAGFLSNQKEFEQSSGIVMEFEKCLEMMPKNIPLSAKQILDRCKPKNSFFLAFDKASPFSKKILTPLIGQDFQLEDGRQYIFESAGKSNDKSALFILNSIVNDEIPEEQEVPELDNILLISEKINKVKTLFDIPEDVECIIEN